MRIYAPNYYSRFHCIANQCQHSCCIGWEIDIDAASLARYQRAGGPLGKKLRQNIVADDCPHFKLDANERCPFLTDSNLCQLILTYGEASLCQICTDHPRFRSFFTGRTELGLGLCCEAAGALILQSAEPFALDLVQAEGAEQPLSAWESAVLQSRSRAIALVQNRSLPVWARLNQLEAAFSVVLPHISNARWAALLLSLEQLDAAWGEELEQLQRRPEQPLGPLGPDLEIAFEQLAVYFLYRHLGGSEDEADLKSRIGFALFSCRFLAALLQLPGQADSACLPRLIELARLYSCEIEYSEENTQAILDLLWNMNN